MVNLHLPWLSLTFKVGSIDADNLSEYCVSGTKSVKHFANGRVTILTPIFSAVCAESRFIHFVRGPDYGNWVGDPKKFTRKHITAVFR